MLVVLLCPIILDKEGNLLAELEFETCVTTSCSQQRWWSANSTLNALVSKGSLKLSKDTRGGWVTII